MKTTRAQQMAKAIRTLDLDSRRAALNELLLRAELASARGAAADAELLREVVRLAR